MVQWQCNLRVSRYAQGLTLLLHGAVMLALLMIPWSGSASLARVLLLLLVLTECLRSLHRIGRCRGTMVLRRQSQIDWQQRQWQMTGRPWLTQRVMRLSLQDTTGRRESLWLFADSMKKNQWRLLRLQLLNEKEPKN